MTEKQISYIAAAVTFLTALIILLILFFCGMSFDRALLAKESQPEISALTEDEELFVEPEIVEGFDGAEETVDIPEISPAPTNLGQPQQAEIENSKAVVPGKNENPAPKEENLVSQKKPSPVKTVEPPKEDENKKKVTSKMTGKFSPHNGTESGKSGSSGPGGAGVGYQASVKGRSFLGLTPPPAPGLNSEVIIVVAVTIDASGHVTNAKARSKKGYPSSQILADCERSAKTARWSEDKNTPSATGSITFTISPKK